MSELTVAIARPEDREDWHRFVAGSAAAEAGHLWGYHDLVRQRFGATLHRLVARRGEHWVGVLPLVYQRSCVGRFLTSVPYLNHAGVLTEDAQAAHALGQQALGLAERLGAQRLELRGRDGTEVPVTPWTGKCDYRLTLPDTTDEAWNALSSKVRAQVRRPRKEGFESRVAGGEAQGGFHRMLSRRWHQLGSPILPRAFFGDLGDLFGDDLRYVLVEREGEVAAVGAVLRWRSCVEIPWAASDVRHHRAGVNMLLYWAAIEHAIRGGARVFDLGRSTAGTGNAKFKLQWGAEEHTLTWNVHAAGPRGGALERGDRRRAWAARCWRRLPAFCVDRLGPLLAARIPY